jgi:hypothetical protein
MDCICNSFIFRLLTDRLSRTDTRCILPLKSSSLFNLKLPTGPCIWNICLQPILSHHIVSPLIGRLSGFQFPYGWKRPCVVDVGCWPRERKPRVRIDRASASTQTGVQSAGAAGPHLRQVPLRWDVRLKPRDIK